MPPTTLSPTSCSAGTFAGTASGPSAAEPNWIGQSRFLQGKISLRRALLSVLFGIGVSILSAAEATKAVSPPAAPPARPELPPNPRKLSPPPGIAVPADVRAKLSAGVAELGREITALQATLRHQPAWRELLPDVQIYHLAVKYALEDDIFFSANQFKSAEALLQQGLERARQLREGQAPWTAATGLVVRGYVSKLDGSVQPYGLVVPASFQPGHPPLRLDIWLHGRSDTMNEIAFLEARQKNVGQFAPENTIVLHPYGRFMNAFKFAGEADVFEALAHVQRHYPVDPQRIAMRGFSMGGAGAWHLGAHHADRWAAVNPGAGFVDVKIYQKLGDQLDAIPWYEQKLWALYDPLACPINLTNTTLVAYSGELDRQKEAADLMEAALAKEGIAMTHFIGPQTEHRYEPETKLQVAARVAAAAAKGVVTPQRVTLVTHTLKWNTMHWVTVNALEKHWEEARVDAEIVQGKELQIRARNVASLTVSIPEKMLAAEKSIVLNGQPVDPASSPKAGVWTESFIKSGSRWATAPTGSAPAPGTLQKRHNLQGPIDDAFMDAFIMVRPTGRPLNAQTGLWAEAELQEALFQWRRQFRGSAQVKDDRAIAEEDIRHCHLILWGDPASNRLLAKIADQLPIQWTARGIRVGNKTYDATRYAPVLIYPNPLNPSKYVVINSGFTFPPYSAGTNSQQTPKLPDWAVVDMKVPSGERIGGKGVEAADFFGERWELRSESR